MATETAPVTDPLDAARPAAATAPVDAVSQTTSATAPADAVFQAPAGGNEALLWYKDAVIYQVHVKSFFDSNNDGIGDFQGLTQKLDYVQSLGVTCLWLLPFFPSPLKDDGYDIADYRSVHPSYGTLDDFKAFVRAAHDRNIKVLIELVVNHTSDQHPWFQRARRARSNHGCWSDVWLTTSSMRTLMWRSWAAPTSARKSSSVP